MSQPSCDLLERLPTPAEVRARLVENLDENQALRRLLKVVDKRRPNSAADDTAGSDADLGGAVTVSGLAKGSDAFGGGNVKL